MNLPRWKGNLRRWAPPGPTGWCLRKDRVFLMLNCQRLTPSWLRVCPAGQMLNSCQNCLSLGSLKPRSLPLGGRTAPGEKATNGARRFHGRETLHASNRFSLLLRILASFWRVHAALPLRSRVLNPADAEESAQPRPPPWRHPLDTPTTTPAVKLHLRLCWGWAHDFNPCAVPSPPCHQVPTQENHFELCKSFFFLNSQLSTHFLCQDLLIKQYQLIKFYCVH